LNGQRIGHGRPLSDNFHAHDASIMKFLTGIILAISLAGIAASPAFACACCTSRGQRADSVQTIDDRIRAQLEMLRFRSEAKLALGERYEGVLVGIDDPTENFTVSVIQVKERITFSLKDAKDRAGTLTLIKPHQIAIFEVDQHDTPDSGLGPTLYKEWRIATAVAGAGMFRDNAGPNRRITLVLHGRGNSCTDIGDFRHWSLHVRGHGTEPYTFYGELASGHAP